MKNCKEVFEEIKQLLPKCSFVALDEEFTGISTMERGFKDNWFDLPSERFERHRGAFMVNQLGLCLVQEGEGGFTLRPYNFNLFPLKSHIRPGDKDVTFQSQASSLKVLASAGFDFNKWIREGIPFSSLQRTKESLSKEWKQNSAISVSSILHNSPSKSPVSKRLEKIASSGEQEQFIYGCRRDLLTFIHQVDQRELRVTTTSHNEQVILQTLIESDETISTHSIDLEKVLTDETSTVWLLKKPDPETLERRRKETELRKKEREERMAKARAEELGFTQVIELLSESKKPVILHNGLLDLMYMYQQFFAPLPDSYEDFKKVINDTFPKIFDTKLLALSQPFKRYMSNQTKLADIRRVVLSENGSVFEKVKITLPEEFKEYVECSHEHEAGYDAYVTAICFIYMLQHMRKLLAEREGNPPVESPVATKSAQPDEPDGLLAKCLSAVEHFSNRIALGYSDIHYIDLQNKDPIPERKNVFRLTFAAKTTREDIKTLFSPFGSTRVYFLDDTSAYVEINEIFSSPVNCFKYAKEHGAKNNIQVQRFSDVYPHLYPTPTKEEDDREDPVTTPPSTSGLKRKTEAISLKQPPPKKLFVESNDWSN